MMDWLILPFQMPFMRDAFLIGVVISFPCALLSCFLVLKGWALMGDAISHAILPGVVLAYILGLPLILGAFAAGMFTAVATGFLSENSRVKQDTVMGVVFSGMFGLGIVMNTAIVSDIHLNHILYGNMLGVTPEELRTAALIALFCTLVIGLKWKDFMLHAFDPAQARASGLKVGLLHYGLLAMLSLTIVATLTATGLSLAVGLLIAPGAIAFLLVRSFPKMLILATLTCLFAMITGIWASFHLNSEPAPTVILILTAIFLMALAHRLWRNRQRSRQTQGLAH